MEIPEFNHFYLVGGTALSLKYGHRLSIDIDLFSAADFDNDEIEKILHKKIDDLITSYIIKADETIPTILTFHTGIDQAVMGAEKDLMVGKTFSVPLSSVARPEIDYVALGHIHKHQVLCQKPLVIYPGSIERVDFGEEKEDKGFIVLDLEKNNTTYSPRFLPNYYTNFWAIRCCTKGLAVPGTIQFYFRMCTGS